MAAWGLGPTHNLLRTQSWVHQSLGSPSSPLLRLPFVESTFLPRRKKSTSVVHTYEFLCPHNDLYIYVSWNVMSHWHGLGPLFVISCWIRCCCTTVSILGCLLLRALQYTKGRRHQSLNQGPSPYECCYVVYLENTTKEPCFHDSARCPDIPGIVNPTRHTIICDLSQVIR